MAAVGGNPHPHKFFSSRSAVRADLGYPFAGDQFLDYVNVPPLIGMALSRSKEPAGTLHALQTTLSIEDLHDLLEVALVDAHNARIIDRINTERTRRK